MNPKIQKGTLITIIVLLIVFVPLTGFGVYYHFFASSASEENPNHAFYYDNQLWFYDARGSLLSTYSCKTSSCGYAINTIDDVHYAIDSVKTNVDGPLETSRYVFLNDSNSESEAFLFDKTTGTAYKTMMYAAVKNYGGIEGDLFVVQNADGKFGVIQLGNNARLQVSYAYDFLGLLKETNEDGLVLGDYFIGMNDNVWSIIGSNGAVLTESITEEIVSFNGNSLITVDGLGNYHLMSYQGEYLLMEDFGDLSFTGRFLNCVTTNRELYVYDMTNQVVITSTYVLGENDTYQTLINEEGNLQIFINNQHVETVDL